MVGRFFRKTEDAPTAPMSGVTSAEPVAVETGRGGPDMVAERVNLHRFLLDKINLTILDSMEDAQLLEELRPLVRDYVRTNNLPLNAKELDSLV